MDIAEIRKKARAGRKPADRPQPEPDGTATAPAVLPEAGVPDRQPAGDLDLVTAPSGIDRLFAAVGAGRFIAADAYQSGLIAEGGREAAGCIQCLAFQLGTEEYALDITRISEIIKYRECTDIPRVPEFVLGLISLRGVVVPVIDLQRRFNLGEGRLTPEARIIVCREGDAAAGLLVDNITQVLHLETGSIEPPPAILSGVDRYLLEGVGRFQGRMIILLNLAAVLDVAME